jgi:large subunit ribosomal protein L6
MSRVGKKIITLPSSVTVDVSDNVVKVNGSKGSLSLQVKPFIKVDIKDGVLSLTIDNEGDKFQKAIWGTTRALINNNVVGVTDGFKKEMELNGVGYRMELGTDLILYIGFSHPVVVKIPPQIKLTLNKNVLIGESIDKQILGDFFTTIHDMKPCDVYKQKGFKFPNRFYRKKVGKKAK